VGEAVLKQQGINIASRDAFYSGSQEKLVYLPCIIRKANSASWGGW
jgi:hypothetical protein